MYAAKRSLSGSADSTPTQRSMYRPKTGSCPSRTWWIRCPARVRRRTIFAFRSDRQPLAALPAATIQDLSPAGGRHALAKTVGALPTGVVWLKCALHGLPSCVSTGQRSRSRRVTAKIQRYALPISQSTRVTPSPPAPDAGRGNRTCPSRTGWHMILYLHHHRVHAAARLRRPQPEESCERSERSPLTKGTPRKIR